MCLFPSEGAGNHPKDSCRAARAKNLHEEELRRRRIGLIFVGLLIKIQALRVIQFVVFLLKLKLPHNGLTDRQSGSELKREDKLISSYIASPPNVRPRRITQQLFAIVLRPLLPVLADPKIVGLTAMAAIMKTARIAEVYLRDMMTSDVDKRTGYKTKILFNQDNSGRWKFEDGFGTPI